MPEGDKEHCQSIRSSRSLSRPHKIFPVFARQIQQPILSMTFASFLTGEVTTSTTSQRLRKLAPEDRLPIPSWARIARTTRVLIIKRSSRKAYRHLHISQFHRMQQTLQRLSPRTGVIPSQTHSCVMLNCLNVCIRIRRRPNTEDKRTIISKVLAQGKMPTLWNISFLDDRASHSFSCHSCR